MKNKNQVNFPLKGICGYNVLHEELVNLESEKEYSMKAITPPEVLLTIKLKGEEEMSWSFSTSKRNGWFVEPFDSTIREQFFKMDEDSKAEIALRFQGKGIVIIEFYKDSEIQPFASKEIVSR